MSQGNKALMVFEESVGVEVRKRGLEHLGTWNASIQSNKFDGVYVCPESSSPFFDLSLISCSERLLLTNDA